MLRVLAGIVILGTVSLAAFYFGCLVGDSTMEITTRATADKELRMNVEAFMRGESVPAAEFPWYNSGTKRPDSMSLKVCFVKKLISQEEFDAFRNNVELQWKRVEPLGMSARSATAAEHEVEK